MTVVRPQPRTQSVDLCSRAALATPLFTEEAPLVDPGELFMSFSEAKTDTDSMSGFESASGREENSEFLGGGGSVERFSSVCDAVGPASVSACAVKEGSDGSDPTVGPSGTDPTDRGHRRLSPELINRGSVGGREPGADGGEDEGGPGSPGASQTSKGAPADVGGAPADTFSKAEQQDKKKGDWVFDLLLLLTETRLLHWTCVLQVNEITTSAPRTFTWTT